jgi:hypothetical protein
MNIFAPPDVVEIRRETVGGVPLGGVVGADDADEVSEGSGPEAAGGGGREAS